MMLATGRKLFLSKHNVKVHWRYTLVKNIVAITTLVLIESQSLKFWLYLRPVV